MFSDRSQCDENDGLVVVVNVVKMTGLVIGQCSQNGGFGAFG